MNTNNGEGNTEIPEVEDLVIEDTDDVETIRAKTSEWKEKVSDREKKMFARTKKAEGFELLDGKWVKKAKADPEPTKKDEPVVTPAISKEKITHSDMIAVIKADIPEEDLDEIIDYANLKKISVREAIAAPLIKGMLAEKAEQRKTAEGTNTDGSKRGNARLSDEALVANANKGIMPESDEDISRLTRLSLGLKK